MGWPITLVEMTNDINSSATLVVGNPVAGLKEALLFPAIPGKGRTIEFGPLRTLLTARGLYRRNDRRCTAPRSRQQQTGFVLQDSWPRLPPGAVPL